MLVDRHVVTPAINPSKSERIWPGVMGFPSGGGRDTLDVGIEAAFALTPRTFSHLRTSLINREARALGQATGEKNARKRQR